MNSQPEIQPYRFANDEVYTGPPERDLRLARVRRAADALLP